MHAVVPDASMSESLAASPPCPAGLTEYAVDPLGATNTTRYEPAGSPLNEYCPLASVVVLRTMVPLQVCSSTVTPGRPGSLGSCTPSPSKSCHTKSPMLAPAVRRPRAGRRGEPGRVGGASSTGSRPPPLRQAPPPANPPGPATQPATKRHLWRGGGVGDECCVLGPADWPAAMHGPHRYPDTQ